MAEFIENPYRQIHFTPETETRSEAYVVIVNNEVELHSTMSAAMVARDRLEEQHRVAHFRNREKARWRQPREQAVLNTAYETRQQHA